MLSRLRKYLVTGIIVAAPLFVTLSILWVVFGYLDGFLARLLKSMQLEFYFPGLGILSGLVLLVLIGMVTSFYVVQKVRLSFDKWIGRFPLVGDLYTMIKQIAEAIGSLDKPPFQRVVLFRLCENGVYVPGFLTSDQTEFFSNAAGETLVNVFVPTVPNPTTGFLLMVPRKQLIILDIPIDEGVKLIVSAGILNPSIKKDG
ncbi:MAG: DUF502 domain-containing protein [Bacillota bacterium]